MALPAYYADEVLLDSLKVNDWYNVDFIIKKAQNAPDPEAVVVNRRGDGLLQVAASLGLWKPLRILIEEHGVSVNHQTREGETAILCAVRGGYGACCKVLLDSYHADASLASIHGETPMHWLVNFPDEAFPPLASDLLKYGADINAINQKRVNHTRFTSGIDVDIQMPGTPLAWAVHHNRPSIVQWLLDNDADPYLHATVSGNSPWGWAAYFHHHECLKVLIEWREKEHSNSTNEHHNDPRWAVYYSPLVLSAIRSADRFSMILRNGESYLDRLHKTLDLLRAKTTDINLDVFDISPLLYAVQGAHDEVVEYILSTDWRIAGLLEEHAPDGRLLPEGINSPCDPDKITPVLQSVRMNRGEIFHKLIDRGGDVRLKALNPYDDARHDFSALHLFAYEGHEDLALIESIIALGVPVDGTPLKGTDSAVYQSETPLSIALRRSALSQAKCLISHGADLNALSYSAALTTALHPLTILGHAVAGNMRFSTPRITQLLQSFPARPAFIVEPQRLLTILHRCAMAHRDLFETGSGDQSTRTKWDFTTAIAIMQELLKVFKQQEELDAQCDIDDKTALHLSVEVGNPDMVELLVEAGASCRIRDKNGSIAADLVRTSEGSTDERKRIEMALIATTSTTLAGDMEGLAVADKVSSEYS
ncbi:MAG: hypothetical protein Q9162_006442 [Coniocarpon cinnabarinum]